MSEEDWEELARKLVARHDFERAATWTDARRHLVELDGLFRSAPHQIELRFKRISEDTLRALSVASRDSLDAGSPMTPTGGDVVRAAAARVRALDLFLLETNPIRGVPDEPGTDYLCTATKTHVLPRARATPPADFGIGSLTYDRRGILWHRLIPAVTAEGYSIALQWHAALSLPLRVPEAKVVSAQFADLHLVRDEAREWFVARDAPCADEAETLDRHAAAIGADGVVLSVLPELTVPPDRRERLSATLRQAGLKAGLRPAPCIVVAGSWHEEIEGAIHNRMHVLSGMGVPCFYHDKSLALESNGLGHEELVPSWRIPVLITPDALIAFAICRDFCEGQYRNTYARLDVDLLVVPSYGDRKTIESHERQAGVISTDAGMRTFVVQQGIPAERATSRYGYVLPPLQVFPAPAATLATTEPVSTFPLSFKTV